MALDFLRLKRIVTVLMISSHLLTFATLLVMYFVGGFAFDDLTTSIGLLTPLFAGFTTMIVKDAIVEAAPDAVHVETRAIPGNYALLTLSFCGAFTLYLLIIVIMKGFNIGFASFDQFKILLGASETVFAVYVGTLLPTLFSHGGTGRKSRTAK